MTLVLNLLPTGQVRIITNHLRPLTMPNTKANVIPAAAIPALSEDAAARPAVHATRAFPSSSPQVTGEAVQPPFGGVNAAMDAARSDPSKLWAMPHCSGMGLDGR